MDMRQFLYIASAIAFVPRAFAAGLAVPSGRISLGEVQPSEVIEKTAEVKMMAGGTVFS